MIVKELLSGPFSISREVCNDDRLSHWVVNLRSLGDEFRNEGGDLDGNISEVREFYEIFAGAMKWYTTTERGWDPTEIAGVSIGDSDQLAVFSSERRVHGVLNVALEDWSAQIVHNNEEKEVTGLRMGVKGVVVNPKLRGKGIASRLFGEMVRFNAPLLVTGNTNSEQAALSRARILEKLGYVTFVSNESLASEESEIIEKANKVAKAYVTSQRYENSSGVKYKKAPFAKFKPPDRLGAIRAEVKNQASVLRGIFDEVEALQKECGDGLIQVPLVSVHVNSLLGFLAE